MLNVAAFDDFSQPDVPGVRRGNHHQDIVGTYPQEIKSFKFARYQAVRNLFYDPNSMVGINNLITYLKCIHVPPENSSIVGVTTCQRQGASGLEPTPVADLGLSYMSIQRILIVRACAVGDFVLNLPALSALQKMHSYARFTLVGNPSTLDLCQEFVDVESIHSIEAQPWSRLFYEPIGGLEFDSAIVWMKDPTIAENLRRSGISNVFRADPFPAYGHAADHLLRTLKLARPNLPDLWSPAFGDIVVHAGSGSPKKNWAHFEELMNRVEGCVCLPTDLALRDLSHYLRQCRAFIGNDSGITHLAAYLGCPTVALFGPTDPRVWGPIGRRSRIIWKRKLEEIRVDEVVLALHATHT